VFGNRVKVKLDKALYAKLRDAAEHAGYSSAEELIRHVLEREADKLAGEAQDRAEVEKQLRGLGYIE
jgi:metal-responsive CopG/Arc/MetJ family transcriptional regulator